MVGSTDCSSLPACVSYSLVLSKYHRDASQLPSRAKASTDHWKYMFMKSRYGEEMTKLYQKYGPVVGLKMGSFPAIVLSGKELIKEGLRHSSLQDKPHFMYAVNKCCTLRGLK